jgi:hypothetical protein
MAWQLVHEVVTFLQTKDADQLNASERLALMLVAERASAETRKAWESDNWNLGRALGVNRTRQVLEKLASRDLDIRVQVGMDGKGKPVFAFRGKSITYQLPCLIAASSSATVDNSSQNNSTNMWDDFEQSGPVDNYEEGASTDAPFDSDEHQSVSAFEKGASVGPKGASTDAPHTNNQIKKPPRSLTTVTSPCEEREESQKRGDIISNKSKADNQDVVQTILNMPGIHNQMSRFGEARLRVAVEACQQRGITNQQMISAVGDRSFDGVRYLERALSARLEALEVRTPDVDTKVERCRLHDRSDALHCPSCWGLVKAGSDPYEGCEDQRPENWHTVYKWSPSVKTVTMDETEIEPLNLPATFTSMLA